MTDLTADIHATIAEFVSHATVAHLTGRGRVDASRLPEDLLPIARDILGAALMAVLRAQRAGLHGTLPAGVEGHFVGGRR